MKERYLSKSPNVTFVYLSKCNIELPVFLEIPKKGFCGLDHVWSSAMLSGNTSFCIFVTLSFPTQAMHITPSIISQMHKWFWFNWEKSLFKFASFVQILTFFGCSGRWLPNTCIFSHIHGHLNHYMHWRCEIACFFSKRLNAYTNRHISHLSS